MHSLPNSLHCAGFKHALQHFAALRGFGIGDAHAGHVEAPLRIPRGIAVANAQRRLRDEPQAAPLEIGTQLEDLRHGLQRGAIAFPRHHALVLVLDLGLAGFSWRSSMTMDCSMSSGSKPETTIGLRFVARNPLVGAAADHGGDVAGADEGVDAHVGRIENGADGGNDGDVIAEDGEIADAFGLWRASA